MPGAGDRVSQVALVEKNLPANEGDIRDVGLIPGLGRSLEEEMATHSSIRAWRIPWTGEPGGLQSIGLKRVRHNLITKQKQQNNDLEYCVSFKCI